MPTAIAVTSPDLALPATDRQTPAAVVLPAPHLQPLDEALTETSAVLEHHGEMVVLYSSACPPEHVRRLHSLRAVLESDRIAIVPVPLPPLGLALLARQLRQLSPCDFSPGVLASAARLLTHYIHAGALLGSVTGLDRIEVDLRAHMKSWLPGAHFAVLANPEPHLVHLDRHCTEAGLRGPGYGTQLAVARGQLTAEWVTRTLAPAWQVQGAYEARLPAESARWWGTQKLIEFAAAIPDLSVLHQLVASVRREECGWCGRELLGDRCAFCAAPLARERGARGGSSARGPAAIAGPERGTEHAPPPAAEAALPPAAEAGPSPATGAAPAAEAAPAAGAGPARAPRPAVEAGPAVAPGAPSGPPPSGPWAERGLSPVVPSGVPGVPGPGSTTGAAAPGVPDDSHGSGTPYGPSTPYGAEDSYGAGISYGTGTPDVSYGTGTPVTPDTPYGPGAPGTSNGTGTPYGSATPYGAADAYGSATPYAPGDAYGSGRPVPGNPYASDGPRVPGLRHLPGHPDAAGEPEAPGVPRTVARVR
ncbi:hypothetical protein ACFCVY_29545 [Streptomyces sp. NPDC056411]|uniref:hypothetical protein n=1 Tax=Streptomyces sp. NPDC056411 TaxID=3345813 RepID=UPI0035D831DE